MLARMMGCVLAAFAVLPSLGHAQHDGHTSRLLAFTDFTYLLTERDIPASFREGQVVGQSASFSATT